MGEGMGVGPKIKLVDARGYTVCVFERWAADEATSIQIGDKVIEQPAMEERWMAVVKPASRKSQRHIELRPGLSP
jgi:hypothetical protein